METDANVPTPSPTAATGLAAYAKSPCMSTIPRHPPIGNKTRTAAKASAHSLQAIGGVRRPEAHCVPLRRSQRYWQRTTRLPRASLAPAEHGRFVLRGASPSLVSDPLLEGEDLFINKPSDHNVYSDSLSHMYCLT